ncbi:hypothetical protein SASPL_148197 [Salvia splendens]|uniref:BED-type domain-containing protein n=1 Tax=Salvia splendens TaxID=180675 RepID=A0A8X8Z357_SALSN|nr:hypothetical protein SASPL_148197 [Salvia splendens]
MDSSQAMNMSLDSHDLEAFGILRDIKVKDQSEHVRKRRKTDESPGSIYWNDYTRVWVEEGDPPIMKLEGMCKHCGTFISVNSSGCGANGLRKHNASCLKRKVALQAGRSQTVKANTSLTKWKFDQRAIRPALCEMVILQELPFTFVECDIFADSSNLLVRNSIFRKDMM